MLLYFAWHHGRRFVLKFGGDDERGACGPAHGHRPYVLVWVREGVAASRHGGPFRGYYPRNFLKITVQNRAILCKIWQYLCRKSTAKVVLISDILLAYKADSQPNKRELNFNCLQLQHSYVQSHPRLRRFKDELECGPMPNLMVALPNIGGALCSMP